MVRRDADVACGLQGLCPLPCAVEPEGDTPCLADAADNERRSLDELEFELAATGVGAIGAEGCVDLLEDDSLATDMAEFFVVAYFVIRVDGGGCISDLVRESASPTPIPPGTCLQCGLLAPTGYVTFN